MIAVFMQCNTIQTLHGLDRSIVLYNLWIVCQGELNRYNRCRINSTSIFFLQSNANMYFAEFADRIDTSNEFDAHQIQIHIS